MKRIIETRKKVSGRVSLVEVAPRRGPEREQGAWICYQLRLIGLTQGDIAQELGVTRQMVQRVAYGLVTSARVQKGIAIALGYKNWADLSEAREGVAA
jgi:DNA-binding transcriptional regulator LsrR (DeoR family)